MLSMVEGRIRCEIGGGDLSPIKGLFQLPDSLVTLDFSKASFHPYKCRRTPALDLVALGIPTRHPTRLTPIIVDRVFNQIG